MQNKYEKDDSQILIAKVQDKQKFCKSKNKITYSDFLNQAEKKLILKRIKLERAFFYGGCENSEREVLFFYPEKINEETAQKAVNNFISAVRICLPNDMKGKYEHRNYLSALIKIGMMREKIGDIIVDENGADIVIFNINSDFIMLSLSQLTRFKKCKIEQISINDIREKKDNYEYILINVPSLRIDAVVSELAKCSRNIANELIEQERVFINYENVNKGSKIVECEDIVNIRGKGKFIIGDTIKNTRKGNLVVNVKKYV